MCMLFTHKLIYTPYIYYFVLKRQHRHFPSVALHAKGILETDGTIRQGRNWEFHKGVKTSRPEHNGEDHAFALEEVGKFSCRYPSDSRMVFLNDQIHARMSKDLL